MMEPTTIEPVLIAGHWRAARRNGTFRADDPNTRKPLSETFPVSTWEDCEEALVAAVQAAQVLRAMAGDRLGEFLECFAARIEERAEELVARAHAETGLPVSPRLREVELPRTTHQLRMAAQAAREGSWKLATIDSAANIRSWFAPLGPVAVFGPNNFPLAFGSLSGGDFAAAIAAGNPVIGKANSSHPATTRLLAREAQGAVEQTGMPAGMVQLIYRLTHQDGQRLVADPRLGATGYTGSRSAGLTLKAAADRAGKPIYVELSSVNPVVILPGALATRGDQIVEEFTTSCLMGTGQFCTNPGLLLLLRGPAGEAFVAAVARRFAAAPVGTLLSSNVQQSLQASIRELFQAGAAQVAGDSVSGEARYCCANTLLRIGGEQFLADPATFQREAFGNASLVVMADDVDQLYRILECLEGNLTGCIYSDLSGSDDDIYDQLAPLLRLKVGRLLNDKMPTGVAVSPAMNHGGPYPATGHPGFTAVGIPASLRRFAMLQCYDNVRSARLPAGLRDTCCPAGMWRLIDGRWTQDDVKRP
ncbi:MAG: aldehyde dehydrogenase (NADP(+)) [Pirellulaceae bacterium]